MIKLCGPTIPNRIYVACSGGVDSMAAFSFLDEKPYRNITAAFFHHGTETSERALEFLIKSLNKKTLVVGKIDDERSLASSGKSPEEFWRVERYKFLHGLDAPVVMAHHLDDCVETWLFGALNGTPKTIPYRNGNVIRPFLLTRKKQLVNWCERHNVEWVEDESNEDMRYMRNRIRHHVVPEALKVNPGLHKVVARKVQEAKFE